MSAGGELESTGISYERADTKLQRQVEALTGQLKKETEARKEAQTALAASEKEAAGLRQIVHQYEVSQAAKAASAQAATSLAEQLLHKSAQVAELQAQRGSLEKELMELEAQARGAQADAEKSLADFLQNMQKEKEELQCQHAAALEDLHVRYQRELTIRQQLAEELDELKRQNMEAVLQTPHASSEASEASEVHVDQQEWPLSPSSEGRLRLALTQSGVTTQDLKEAVQAVESLLCEARRELATRQLRERRAAFEQLHAAIAKGNEAVLVEAIIQAKRTEVDVEDIQKAEVVLQELRALTEDQRAAKDAREHQAKSKEMAFLLVKRDDVVALREHLAGLDDLGVPWQGWKDHARRTLLQCARDLGSTRVQSFLQPLLAPPPAKERNARAEESCITPRVTPIMDVPPECSPAYHERRQADDSPMLQGVSGAAAEDAAPETTPEVLPSKVAGAPSLLGPVGETELRAKAFRAVVQDDTSTLADVISSTVPCCVWSKWRNKGGKDLLTLSEERGSPGAYSMLARALGVLTARKRDCFEEREAVWVMFAGEVQPRRATVVNDTPEEADSILLEFWDGNEPPMLVDRDFVLKTAN